MTLINILGIDPSLRATGIALVSYDTQKTNAVPFISYCNVITVPKAFKGHEAVLHMIDQLIELPKIAADQVIIESPAAIYSPKFPSSSLFPICHIAGACVPIFGADISYLIYPSEWNRSRKKDKSQAKIIDAFGPVDKWTTESAKIRESLHEHLLDAAGMALYWIESRYSGNLMVSHDSLLTAEELSPLEAL